MSEFLNTDPLRNWRPGVLDRFEKTFSEHGVGLISLGVHRESAIAPISGNLLKIEDYVRRTRGKSEWLSAVSVQEQVKLFGKFKHPIPNDGPVLVGSGFNIRAEDVERIPGHVEVDRQFDRAFLIGGRGGAIFGHWLLDYIPQALLALEAVETHSLDIPILVANCPSFGRALLSLIDIEDRCVFLKAQETISVGHLYYPMIQKHGGLYSKEFIARGFQALSERVPDAETDFSGFEKVLVGRSKPPNISNFDALRGALEPMGFRVVFPEQYALEDQIRIFREARIVVGEDGSALHNVGFCAQGTKLIVCSRGEKVNYWHASVTEAAGASLVYLASQTENGSNEYTAPVQDILQATQT